MMVEVTGIEKDCNYKDNDQFERHILFQMRKLMDKFEVIEKYIKFQFEYVTLVIKTHLEKQYVE